MSEPEFRKKISERMWKIEGLFAEAKQNHCLARANYRGRPKVQIQAYLIAIVQNLKRLLFPLYGWLLARGWSYSTRHRAGIAVQPIPITNQLLNEKSIRSF